MTIAEGGRHAIELHAHDMHPCAREGGVLYTAEQARCRGHCCKDDFVEWVSWGIRHAEGIQGLAARFLSLLMRVQLAAERLVDGDAMRRSTQTAPQVDWLVDGPRDSAIASSHVLSLEMWVRMCGPAGRAWRRSA